jgi:Ca-activated chloride channel family protein
VVALAAAPSARPLASDADNATPLLKITSPLGRTGLPGVIRVVARLDGVDPAVPVQVDFYVDKRFHERDEDGPPFDALWTDDSPFEPRELTVQAVLPSGQTLTDTISLKPLQVTERAEIMSVTVEASVRDGKGRFIRDLRAPDFEILEDTEPQDIDLVTQQRDPALFALLVDSSQSMAIRADAVRETASRLLKPLEPDDQIVVAPFSKRIVSITGPTTDRETVLGAIDAIRPAGGTAILDALGEAAAALSGGARRRAIVLITDGYDEHSESASSSAVDQLRKSDITLYVVGLGGVAGISLRGEKLLGELASETGGRAWFPRDERQLAVAYDTIAMDVRHKYLLTYTPHNQRQDGTWRAIGVQAKVPGLNVQARKGYTAPLAPPVRAALEFVAVGTGQAPVTVTREDVVVVEDGTPQEIDTFHEAILPVTFMLALDGSGSMKRGAAEAQRAARDFVMAMRPEDEIGMILFADTADFIHSPTRRRDWSLEAIDTYIADGGTALYDALYDSLAQIADVRGRRVVVVVTDGHDENRASNGPGSLRTWDDVLRKLAATDATVYAIGIGARVDRARLQELADRSGGAAYFPAQAASLSADFNKILDELRRRYVVGYQSTNRIRDGRWRRVEIRPKAGGVQVRSRGGYYAPAQ